MRRSHCAYSNVRGTILQVVAHRACHVYSRIGKSGIWKLAGSQHHVVARRRLNCRNLVSQAMAAVGGRHWPRCRLTSWHRRCPNLVHKAGPRPCSATQQRADRLEIGQEMANGGKGAGLKSGERQEARRCQGLCLVGSLMADPD